MLPWTLLDGSAVKNPSASAGDTGSIPGSGRSPGEGNGNPLQYSCPENLMDRGAWRAPVRRITESDTTEWAATTQSLCFALPRREERDVSSTMALSADTPRSRTKWCIVPCCKMCAAPRWVLERHVPIPILCPLTHHLLQDQGRCWKDLGQGPLWGRLLGGSGTSPPQEAGWSHLWGERADWGQRYVVHARGCILRSRWASLGGGWPGITCFPCTETLNRAQWRDHNHPVEASIEPAPEHLQTDRPLPRHLPPEVTPAQCTPSHLSSLDSSRPRDRTAVSYISCIGRWVLYR